MDAKTRNLVLLGGLSLFCAGVAWISGYFVWGSVFVALGGVAGLEIALDSMGLTWTKTISRSSAPQPRARPASGAGKAVGRIFKVHAAPVGTPWMWTVLYGYHEDRTPTHGYEPTREAAMAAFAKSWRRE